MGVYTLSLLGVGAALAVACDYVSDLPPAFTIVQAELTSGDQSYSPTDGGAISADASVPAESLQVELELVVSSPAGTWSMTITADGALAVPPADGGLYAVSFTSLGEPVTVTVPVTIVEPAGTGVVHVQIGTTLDSFTFAVSAITPVVTVCPQVASGGCLPDAAVADDSGLGQDGSATFSQDGSVETLPIPGASVNLLRDGDQFLVYVLLPDGMGPATTGSVWSGNISTSGVLALLADGGTTSSLPIKFTPGQPTATVGGVALGVGVGTVAASVGVGAPSVVVLNTASATQAVRQVQLLGYVGLGAQNRFSLCSTRAAGSVQVHSTSDASTVTPSQAALTVAPPSICPAGYLSEAEFVWTGYDPNAFLTITDETSGTVTGQTVPTLGTGAIAAVIQSGSAAWVCAADEAGVISTPDGGAGNPCPGAGTAVVTLVVSRTGPGGTGAIPSVGSVVQVEAPAGVQVESPPSLTDTNGDTTFQILVAQGATAIPLVISVDRQTAQVVFVR
jgi:hypothetical protein